MKTKLTEVFKIDEGPEKTGIALKSNSLKLTPERIEVLGKALTLFENDLKTETQDFNVAEDILQELGLVG